MSALTILSRPVQGSRLLQESLQSETENEIICHAAGTKRLHPDVRTIIEIRGQDCKLILLEHREEDQHCAAIEDFAMNESCEAGTGALPDEQVFSA